MKKWVKIVGTILLVFIAIVSASVASFLIRSGAFRDVNLVSPGECRRVPTGHGSAEDIDVDRQNGIAYLSALDRRGLVTGELVTGTILQLDLTNPDAKPFSALSAVPDGFRPHGISLFDDGDGSQLLFVINHSNGTEEKIEIFRKGLNENQFTTVESLSGPLLSHPNDIVAVGPRQFFIANDSGASNAIERAGEMLLGIGLSPLVYFDGANFEVVDTGLRSSGGINADLGKNRLFVGETMGKAIQVYDLNKDRSMSHHMATIELDSGIDNIDLDSEGSLWIANHTNTLALVRHFGDSTSPAPSQVQKISVIGDEYGPVSTVLETNGEDFSASSVAARYHNFLVMGSITEPVVMLCTLDTK